MVYVKSTLTCKFKVVDYGKAIHIEEKNDVETWSSEWTKTGFEFTEKEADCFHRTLEISWSDFGRAIAIIDFSFSFSIFFQDFVP